MAPIPPQHTPNSVADQALPRVIHRVRYSAFVMGFAIFASHMQGKDYNLLAWGLLGLQFFIYPHVLHWRIRHAIHPLERLLTHFQIDGFLMGIWCASLGYPLWVTFVILAASVLSASLYGGLRAAVHNILLFVLSGLLWQALTGRSFVFELQTSWPTTALCIVGLMLFLLIAADTAFHRNHKLLAIRTALQQSQQALHHANNSLHTQLQAIHLLQAKLQEQAHRDPLTGLYNRRFLDESLQRELLRCQREGQCLSLLLIDLDHFKRINDTYGHLAGDEVLRQLAAMLSTVARTTDITCRFGGEEFVLLLPNMPQTVALAKADRWRQEFSQTTIVFGTFQIQSTLSIGVATYPGDGTTPHALVHSADRALYRAKTEGRNRVAWASAPTPPTA